MSCNPTDPSALITIVTAFFDIGRSDWSAYARSVDKYFRNFERLCLLDNEIVLFTESKHRARLAPLLQRKPNLRVHYEDDVFHRHEVLLDAIARVQQDPAYRQGISDPSCPEYNSPKYVLINYLKSQFCVEAIDRHKLSERTVAWIDFGYLRKNRQLPLSLRWEHDFDDRIHLFGLRVPGPDFDLVHTIKHNTVYIQGCHIVAPQHKWPELARLMEASLHSLLRLDLMDDDQTLLLMSSQQEPALFTVHPADVSGKLGWFFIFRRFNRCEQRPGLARRLRFFWRTWRGR